MLPSSPLTASWTYKDSPKQSLKTIHLGVMGMLHVNYTGTKLLKVWLKGQEKRVKNYRTFQKWITWPHTSFSLYMHGWLSPICNLSASTEGRTVSRFRTHLLGFSLSPLKYPVAGISTSCLVIFVQHSETACLFLPSSVWDTTASKFLFKWE